MKTIEIIVTPAGQTTVQTLGFSGPSCRDASRFIEQALGQRTGPTCPNARRSFPKTRRNCSQPCTTR
jgi:hypothetical protein